jgi:V8-like Glu-specific endopeptidase
MNNLLVGESMFSRLIIAWTAASMLLPYAAGAQQAGDEQTFDDPVIEDAAEDFGAEPTQGDPILRGPDPERFEFMGRVTMLADPNHDEAVMRYQRSILELEQDELDSRIAAAADAQPEGDLAVLQTLDGRIFRERPRVMEADRFADESESVESQPPADAEGAGEKLPPHFQPEGSPEDRPQQQREGSLDFPSWLNLPTFARVGLDTIFPPAQAKVFGNDGRELMTSSAYPWRAVGVMLHGGNGIGTCSGAMIAPRLILTAAHCFTSNGRSVTRPLFASPAARGIGFNGDRAPFGNRQGIWYWWPDGWNGDMTDIRFDYGVILLTDINWSPGYVFFAKRSATQLDFKKYNTAGYPGRSHDCADSPLASGKCGGYMYRQFDEVRSVVDGRMYHKFDMSSGQSGSPIYEFDSDENKRVIVGIHTNSFSVSNIATRIRSGVFDFLCKRINDPNNHSSFFGDPHC